MNIQITKSKNSSLSDASCLLPSNGMFTRNERTLFRTIRRKHFQEQDLVTLQTCSSAPSVFFQKRDRSLKNPSYSILALDGSMTVSITDNVVKLQQSNPNDHMNLAGSKIEHMRLNGCPFEFLNRILEAEINVIDANSLPTEIAFAAGMIGYLGFGITSQIEKIEKQTKNPLNVPDSMMMLPKTIIYIDHPNDSIHVISRSGSERFNSVLELVERLNDTAGRAQNRGDVRGNGSLKREVPSKTTKLSLRNLDERGSAIPGSAIPGSATPGSATLGSATLGSATLGSATLGSATSSSASIDHPGLSASMSKQDFLDKASTAKKLIEEGQCFQIVLSQRFSGTTSISAAEMFSTLLETAPSTYNYFLNFRDFQYIGASPETMISAKRGQVRLCALAGTRPRGTTQAQDDLNEVELKTNEKELAEHLMLVDLGRNDLGKVCVPGSIKVGPIAQVLKYSNVMHLGTEIFGALESENTPFKALKACFPRGTVSGAPKVRALELLSKLEPEQRGIYAGAVGFFDARGSMDTAIAIRSALLKDGSIHINAGAGIVYDSEPAFEYQETINKASAIAKVFQQVNSEERTDARQVINVRAGAR